MLSGMMKTASLQIGQVWGGQLMLKSSYLS